MDHCAHHSTLAKPKKMATCHCHRDPLATCPSSLQPPPEVNPFTLVFTGENPTRAVVCSVVTVNLPLTSLWLPPVFASCHFSLAGMSDFSRSWHGPSSALLARCRLSARSPQHTGKNVEIPPLWSSSFFKYIHSILRRKWWKFNNCEWLLATKTATKHF